MRRWSSLMLGWYLEPAKCRQTSEDAGYDDLCICRVSVRHDYAPRGRYKTAGCCHKVFKPRSFEHLSLTKPLSFFFFARWEFPDMPK